MERGTDEVRLRGVELFDLHLMLPTQLRLLW